MTDPVINYSEFATLANCEEKWERLFLNNEEETGPRHGLNRGTLLHVGWGRWARGEGATLPEEWEDNINPGGKPGETRTLSLKSFDTEDVLLAKWLLTRFVDAYGSAPPSHWNVISTEEWLSMPVEIDGHKFVIVGRTDALIEIEEKLWLTEVKSAANIKSRLKTVGIEPQPTIYYGLIEANYGRAPFGIMYEGIHTYQWKRDVHPPEDSFQREWIDRSEEQLAVQHLQLNAAVKRMTYLREHPDEAIPNVGTACSWCGVKGQCWAELSGIEPGDIEIEDDGEPV